MGWKQGEGLGKNKEGVVEPIQATSMGDHKFGIGYDAGPQHLLSDVSSKDKRWEKVRYRWQELFADEKEK